MSKASRSMVDSDEPNKLGPDFFNFYKRKVVELFSPEDAVPCTSRTSKLSERKCWDANGKETVEHNHKLSGPLFDNSLEAGVSDVKKERLKALLRQGVNVLSQEVDEMLEPVIAIHRLRSHLRRRKCPSNLKGGASSNGDVGQAPPKKLKLSSSFSSTSLPVHENPVNPGSGGVVDEHLQLLLENDRSQAEEIVTKYSDELHGTLGYMEQQLEELLDTVMSKCRPMTLKEKQQLQKLIQKLPPENLDRVVEIIQHSKPEKTQSSDEIYVDLEKENNVTLWRLYYYVEAVDKARKLIP